MRTLVLQRDREPQVGQPRGTYRGGTGVFALKPEAVCSFTSPWRKSDELQGSGSAGVRFCGIPVRAHGAGSGGAVDLGAGGRTRPG